MKVISLILILTLCRLSVFSQKPNREELKQMRVEFIKSELQLTDEEVAKFIPLYIELSDKTEALHHEKRSLMRNFKKNSLNMSDAELLKIADGLMEKDKAIFTVEQEYYIKFKTVLSPMKLVLLHKAEHEFKRHLIHKMKSSGEMPPPDED